MHNDLDERIGQIFRRLSMLRIELGEPALDRTVKDVLQTLGACAMREAEYSAGIIAARDAARSSGNRTGRIGPCRIDDGIHEESDG